VREITIGEASTHDLEEAALYVQKSLQTQQETFFFALPAADTVSVQVPCPDPLGDMVHPMDIARMIKEQRDSGIITLPIGKSGQSATKVPIRSMVGGPGWAMHIRLPVHQTDDHNLVIQRLPFNPAIRGLYEAIGVTVGSGITADFHEWFYYVHLIWPESKDCGLIEKPIEFQKLLLVAGVISTRSSLQTSSGGHFGVYWPSLPP
jgi:hypothetical protein